MGKGKYIFQGKTDHQRLRVCDSYVFMSLFLHSFLSVLMLLIFCNLFRCMQIGWYGLKFCAFVTSITLWMVKPEVILVSENLMIFSLFDKGQAVGKHLFYVQFIHFRH